MFFPHAGKCLLLFALVFCSSDVRAGRSLKESLAKGLVSLKALSNGGYMGRCLNLELKNNTNQPLALKVDPALIFKPADDRYNPL
jgi:hypothetical protein